MIWGVSVASVAGTRVEEQLWCWWLLGCGAGAVRSTRVRARACTRPRAAARVRGRCRHGEPATVPSAGHSPSAAAPGPRSLAGSPQGWRRKTENPRVHFLGGCVRRAAARRRGCWATCLFLQNVQELLRRRTSEMPLSGLRGCGSRKGVFEITIHSCLYCYFIP